MLQVTWRKIGFSSYIQLFGFQEFWEQINSLLFFTITFLFLNFNGKEHEFSFIAQFNCIINNLDRLAIKLGRRQSGPSAKM